MALLLRTVAQLTCGFGAAGLPVPNSLAKVVDFGHGNKELGPGEVGEIVVKGPMSEDKLMAFCRERMAAYKYPRQIQFVDEIPKTLTGKFLRRMLRNMESG